MINGLQSMVMYFVWIISALDCQECIFPPDTWYPCITICELGWSLDIAIMHNPTA
jgi:hypothetical protein